MLKHFRSPLFLLQSSVLLNLLTILVVFLHFVLAPSERNLKEAENNLALQKLLIDNFEVMNKNINNLGDAQLSGFSKSDEVKEAVDLNYFVMNYRLGGIRQTIEDGVLKSQKETKKLRNLIKEVNDSVKDSEEKISSNVNSLGDAQLKSSQRIDEIYSALRLNQGMFNDRLEDVKKIIVDEVRNSCQ